MSGKFQGEPRWAEHFWGLNLDGEWFEEVGAFLVRANVITEDVERFPELADIASVSLWEDGDGFVHARSFPHFGGWRA